MEYKILIAEDDKDIVEMLSLYLQEEFKLYKAYNGEDALRIIKEEDLALALVDIMMPKMNGFDLIREARRISNVPIIILSAKNLDSDKVLGLNIGADAYLTKPFNPLEVVAYVKATLRRYYKLGTYGSEEASHIYIVGDLELDTERFLLKKRGQAISLTSAEYKILSMFMRTPERVYTKAQLYECVTGVPYVHDDNTVMVHISNIRSKIEDNPAKPQYIKTVRGLGYKLENIKAENE
ncbi:MAG: response regulator transcription factor [bacterium]